MTILFPLVTFMYVTRVLSVEGIGQVHFVKNLASYFCLGASLGVSYYGTREGAKIAKDKQAFSVFFWEIIVITLTSTMLSVMAYFITIYFTPSLYDYRLLLLVNFAGVILAGFSCDWTMTAYEDFQTLSMSSFILQGLCLLSLLWFVRSESDSISYAAILLASSYGLAIFNWINIVRKKRVSFIHLSQLSIKRHIKPIFVMFAMLVSIDLYTMLDTTMIGFMKGDYSVGIYSSAIKVPRLVNSMIAAVGAVLVPRLSYYYDVDRTQFMKYIHYAMKFVFLVSIPGAMLLFTMADEIILLICGSKFTDAIITLRILSPLTMIIPISVLFNNQIFIPMRLEKFVLQSVIMGAIVNLVANFILIPQYGHNGAATASVLAEIVVMSICLMHVKKELQISGLLKKYLNQFMLSVPIFILSLLSIWIFDDIWFRIICCVALCAPVFMLMNKDTLKEMLLNKKGTELH